LIVKGFLEETASLYLFLTLINFLIRLKDEKHLRNSRIGGINTRID
jgi:hypothetical protein